MQVHRIVVIGAVDFHTHNQLVLAVLIVFRIIFRLAVVGIQAGRKGIEYLVYLEGP